MPLFIPITKVDVAQRIVYGTLSEEVPDKTGEILDYASSKPAFQEWSQQFHAASGGKSLGNVRAMHGAIAAGKLTDICFDDEHKRIEGAAKIVDEDAWNKVLEGVYTGFSIGGGYHRRWPDPANPSLMRYTPVLSEVSLVDNPAVPTATFSVVKNDGSTELRRFAQGMPDIEADESPENKLREALQWLQEQEPPAATLEHVQALLRYLDQEEKDDGVEKRTHQKLEGNMQKMKTLEDRIAELSKRMIALERQPLPSKGALRAVAKTQDYAGYSDEEEARTLSTAERARELIKIALANPCTF